MDALERRIADLILDQLRVRDAGLDDAHLTRPLGELDLDSLDTLELVHRLERELQVKSDPELTATFGVLGEYVPYFATLVTRG